MVKGHPSIALEIFKGILELPNIMKYVDYISGNKAYKEYKEHLDHLVLLFYHYLILLLEALMGITIGRKDSFFRLTGCCNSQSQLAVTASDDS